MQSQPTPKLALGTVQFGLDYGIANDAGVCTPEEAAAILDSARLAGIDLLDTAGSYGSSERIIGRNLRNDDHFRIVTKVSSFSDHLFSDLTTKHLEEKFMHSLFQKVSM